MIFKNLLRRKGRTALTVLGIAVGVAAIVALGALANGIEAGWQGFLTGSEADLIVSQPDAMDVSLSTVDDKVLPELEAMSEVRAASGMLQGIIQTESIPMFFVYGYPEDSFILERFNIIDGHGLDSREARTARGNPVLLGASAADVLNKVPGDTLRLQESVYRVVGIYETGETLEDNGAVIRLEDAQVLLGRVNQVSIYYLQLKDLNYRDRVVSRIERRFDNLEVSGSADFADDQMMSEYIQGFAWVIAGLAIVIGGVGMMNGQLMAVMERTQEIGVLRSIGWKRGRILGMILSESILVGLIGGALGIGLGWLVIYLGSDVAGFFGASAQSVTVDLIVQAIVVVVVLGFVGGMYPAWQASKLEPVEALRYEGGSAGEVRRLPLGGMALQNLWQRTSRTLLTLGAIGLTVGGIMSLEGFVEGAGDMIADMGPEAEVMVRQAGVADTEYSALDERVGDRIRIYPEVEHVSGMAFTGTVLPESNAIFIIIGYSPGEKAITNLNIVEGKRIQANRQVMLGRVFAEAQNLGVGDTLELSGIRYKIVGLYESTSSWMEMGGVITLRDAQSYMGRPRKVTMYMVGVMDPADAQKVVERINADIPEAHASVSGEFVEQMPDMENVGAMIGAVSFLAIAVGGVGVMNTMLMSVLERTREIGVLRALGWRRRRVLWMIIKEATLLGVLGGLSGVGIAFVLSYLVANIPMLAGLVSPVWTPQIFIRAFSIAMFLGLLGGLYPAFRATRLQPVEALRYE